MARHLLMGRMSYTVQRLRQNDWRRFGICAPSEGEAKMRENCTPSEGVGRGGRDGIAAVGFVRWNCAGKGLGTPSEGVGKWRENATPSEGVGRDRRDGIAAVSSVRWNCVGKGLCTPSEGVGKWQGNATPSEGVGRGRSGYTLKRKCMMSPSSTT